MSRTRMFGAFLALVGSAALVAGCGGGDGFVAAESAPTPSAETAAPAAAAAPTAASGAQGVIGTFDPSDPTKVGEQTFKGFDRFDRKRAGKIFVDQTEKAPAAAPSIPAVPGSTPTTPTTDVPTNPTTPGSETPTPVSTALIASLNVSGVVQTVKVGDNVPQNSPQFTVEAVTLEKVVLKLTTGTLPGGGNTQDILIGQSITLTNPSGQSFTITLEEIKAAAV